MSDIRKMNRPEKITHEHLILCEGEDEKQFLIHYLNSKERSKDDPRFESSVQVWNFGGNDQLRDGLAVVRRTEGFSQVKTLLVMRDAERDASAAKEQIRTALSQNDFAAPEEPGIWSDSGKPFTAYLLFPALGIAAGNGTLEHLCMDIIRREYQPEIVLPRIFGLMNKLEEDNIRTFRHGFKSKLHGFASMTDQFVGLKLGEMAKAGAFDWNSEKLAGLSDCLMEGFNKGSATI